MNRRQRQGVGILLGLLIGAAMRNIPLGLLIGTGIAGAVTLWQYRNKK